MKKKLRDNYINSKARTKQLIKHTIKTVYTTVLVVITLTLLGVI